MNKKKLYMVLKKTEISSEQIVDILSVKNSKKDAISFLKEEILAKDTYGFILNNKDSIIKDDYIYTNYANISIEYSICEKE